MAEENAPQQQSYGSSGGGGGPAVFGALAAEVPERRPGGPREARQAQFSFAEEGLPFLRGQGRFHRLQERLRFWRLSYRNAAKFFRAA